MRILYTLLVFTCFISINNAQFCSGTTILSDCVGEFGDGSGTSAYADDSDCAWLIQVPMDSTITLIFNSFQTESCCDELSIYNGSNSNAPLIGTYAGSSIPSSIQSSTNELYLEFTTDGSLSAAGWSVSYYCNNVSFTDLGYPDPGFSNLIVVNETTLEYEFELTNNGNLDSGPFDIGFYASDNIDISTSDVLMFTVSVDSLPSSSSLVLSGMNDVRDSIPPGSYNHIGFIIDLENEIEEISEGNNIFTETFEDIHIPYCSELTEIMGCQGTISDGSGFDDVIRESQCSWLIISENNETVLLDFFNVDLNSSDRIRIFDGDDQNATLIHEFKGSDDFYPVVSSGNSLYVEFEASFFSEEGWNAEYVCTDSSSFNFIMEPSSSANSTLSEIDFDLNIRNNGNTSTPSTKVYFYGSVDDVFNIDQDFLLDSVELSPLGAFDEVQLSYSIDAIGVVPGGEYRPIAVIDAFDDFLELNEEDNFEVFTDRFYIPYCPDTTTIIDDCSGFLTDGSGFEGYTPGTDCRWLLSAEEGMFVSLSPENIDLGSSSTKLRLYNGADNLSQLIAEYSGSNDDEIPFMIISTGEAMYLEFETSDFSTFGSGWNFQYSCTEDVQVNLNYEVDFISANSFNKMIDYDFNIKNFGNGITPSTKVYFFVSENQAISPSNIILDSITVPTLDPYESFSVDFILDLNNLEALIPGGSFYGGFIIDPLDQVSEFDENDNTYFTNQVFDFPYCAEGPILVEGCEGVIEDGSGNNEYSDDSDCTWLVQGALGSNIRLTFTEFNTELCCDFVSIYDGINDNAPLLATYSGSSLPATIQTSQPNVFIEFETDGSATRSGWEIEYECIQFFGDLQFKNGSAQIQVVNNILNFATIIENDGVLPTDEFGLGFILSEDQIPTIGDFLLSTEAINSLDPGEEIEHEAMIDLSDLDIPNGEYFLIVRLDVGEVIEENDEMDNNFISVFPIDIISSSEDVFGDTGILVFNSNQSIVIKNDSHNFLRRMNIMKTDGAILLDQRIESANSEFRFDVSDYSTGVYIVRIELEDQILVKKLFIP